MKKLSAFWQKLIVWFTGYANIIAFVVAGGYLYLNTDKKEVKTSAKTALIVTVTFTALELLRSLILYIMYLANATYATTSVMSDVSYVFSILKMVTFVTLFVLDLCGIQPIKLLPFYKDEDEDKDEVAKENDD